MRNTLAVLHGIELHGGQDLDHAFNRCEVASETVPSARRSALTHATDSVGALLTDAGNVDLAGIALKSCVAVGIEPVSGTTMRVLFRGRPRTLEFAMRHVLGSDDFELCGFRAGPARDSDVIVTDHALLDGGAWTRTTGAIRALPWLRQCADLGPAWPDTLNRLPGSVRKKLRRRLGQHDYRARIVSDMPAKLEFYERYLLPYVRRRFGAGAVAPKERTYRSEARDSVLFELRSDDQFLGASLLKRAGNTLCIGRTAYAANDHRPSGEILDFFCLVLAQRLGCRRLDLGLSRPHIDDGVFRNKTKWRPELVLPDSLKSAVRIRPLRASAATLGFLRRNGFVERRGGRFVVRRLLPAGEPGQRELDQLSKIAGQSGLDEIVVGYAGATRPTLPARVRLCPLGTPTDPVAEFLGLACE